MVDERPRDADLEKQEDLKAARTRRMLKWAILVAVLTLLVIVGVAIPMALKVAPKTSESARAAVPGGSNDPGRPQTVDPVVPTAFPTAFPTGTPYPTDFPTRTPAPSDEPPSARPTQYPTGPPPTRRPTRQPTPVPTTSAPTYTPIDPNYAFKLRLFWQRGFYWQESWNEVWHCVECTRCTEYGAGDGWEHGCQRLGDGNEANCREGDMFWIDGCNGRGSRFNVVTNPGSGHQIRVHGTNLCFGRGAISGETGLFSPRLMKAVVCNKNDGNQLWAPFPSLSKFELRPYNQIDWPEEDAECISQLHHPKNTEVISMHGCKLSRIYETRYWEEYQG